MPRKSVSAFLKLLIGGVVVLLILRLHSAAAYKSLLFVVIAAGAAIGTVIALANKSRNIERQALMLRVNDLVSGKLDQLTRRRAQLVRPDAYGTLHMERWAKEVEYFIDNHLVFKLTQQEQQLFQHERAGIASLITERTNEKMQVEGVFEGSLSRMKSSLGKIAG
jgi:hypothetical protein